MKENIEVVAQPKIEEVPGGLTLIPLPNTDPLPKVVFNQRRVATVYISEIKQALDAGSISYEHFQSLAVAINTGTNLPSVATPNGQAAFLFLLTSAIAPLVRLSYGRMVVMAFPYTVVMGGVGLYMVMYHI